MTVRLTLVVLLHVHAEHRDEYERFELAAARIMSRYGGCIERRIACVPAVDSDASDERRPDEVHVVTFPSAQIFESYARDPELQALRELRERAIRRTVVLEGTDLPAFE